MVLVTNGDVLHVVAVYPPRFGAFAFQIAESIDA